jgi:hypothetical protein
LRGRVGRIYLYKFKCNGLCPICPRWTLGQVQSESRAIVRRHWVRGGKAVCLPQLGIRKEAFQRRHVWQSEGVCQTTGLCPPSLDRQLVRGELPLASCAVHWLRSFVAALAKVNSVVGWQFVGSREQTHSKARETVMAFQRASNLTARRGKR